MDPYGKVVTAIRRPALILAGAAAVAAIAHAFWAPFPASGGNPVLDLIAYHDPGFHTVIRVWYYVAPAVAVLLAGSLGLSVWRVWLQPRAGGGRRGTLPPWPASPEDETPSLVIGELHHPVVPRESERPSWLVVPETGLYTGILIVGAVGSGKTSACMYPFAQQLLSWQADRPARRASALVLEVKGDFCPLTLLYKPLSKQLHGLTDEECLQQAADIRVVLTALLENIADVLKAQDELREAATRLNNPTSQSAG